MKELKDKEFNELTIEELKAKLAEAEKPCHHAPYFVGSVMMNTQRMQDDYCYKVRRRVEMLKAYAAVTPLMTFPV